MGLREYLPPPIYFNPKLCDGKNMKLKALWSVPYVMFTMKIRVIVKNYCSQQLNWKDCKNINKIAKEANL